MSDRQTDRQTDTQTDIFKFNVGRREIESNHNTHEEESDKMSGQMCEAICGQKS